MASFRLLPREPSFSPTDHEPRCIGSSSANSSPKQYSLSQQLAHPPNHGVAYTGPYGHQSDISGTKDTLLYASQTRFYRMISRLTILHSFRLGRGKETGAELLQGVATCCEYTKEERSCQNKCSHALPSPRRSKTCIRSICPFQQSAQSYDRNSKGTDSSANYQW